MKDTGRKGKAKFRVGQLVFRGQFDDFARIAKVGKGWVMFEDFRVVKAQYIRSKP